MMGGEWPLRSREGRFRLQANRLDPEMLERWERIDGQIYDMSPSPTIEHQRAVGSLFRLISNHLQGKTCEAFVAPFDVFLDGDELGNYVQPDITVVCDPSKLQSKGCLGVPDMVVEVLSPNTAKKDKGAKLRAFRKAGVRECWIVDPYNRFVEVFLLTEEGNAFPTVYSQDDTVAVNVLAGLTIDLKDIF